MNSRIFLFSFLDSVRFDIEFLFRLPRALCGRRRDNLKIAKFNASLVPHDIALIAERPKFPL